MLHMCVSVFWGFAPLGSRGKAPVKGSRTKPAEADKGVVFHTIILMFFLYFYFNVIHCTNFDVAHARFSVLHSDLNNTRFV